MKTNNIDDLHIVKSRRKWGVYKRHSFRSLRNFKHRDLAFAHALKYKDARIIVHNEDGSVDFIVSNNATIKVTYNG